MATTFHTIYLNLLGINTLHVAGCFQRASRTRITSDKGPWLLTGAELGSLQLLCEEGGTSHSYKKPVDGLTALSRQSWQTGPRLYCWPRMAQNGTKENGVAEEIPALPLPLPVKVQDIRHTKVRGLQAQLLQVGIVSVSRLSKAFVFLTNCGH